MTYADFFPLHIHGNPVRFLAIPQCKGCKGWAGQTMAYINPSNLGGTGNTWLLDNLQAAPSCP